MSTVRPVSSVLGLFSADLASNSRIMDPQPPQTISKPEAPRRTSSLAMRTYSVNANRHMGKIIPISEPSTSDLRKDVEKSLRVVCHLSPRIRERDPHLAEDWISRQQEMPQ